MWHEQRRTEKMIKGMMVDRQKRAERRRAYYDKFKADPNQFLQVHGQSMKIHYDPVAADNPANMMPWNGDRQILIDRFDVRANLDYIPEYKPPKEDVKLDYKEVKENRNVNYERYRILIQNEFLSIQEEKFLKMIDLEEKYGGTTYQNEKAKADKKKSATNKAAIGFVYADSTAPEPESDPEPSDSDTDSEPDFDLNVDVMALGTAEQEAINTIGVGFELGKKDFVKMLARDVEEAEELRMEREKDNEKSKLSGKKSRRERKLLKEKMLEGRRVSSPSFAAKDERSRSRSYSESESDSEEGGGEEDKVEFITSFGGDSDPENTKKGFTFRKTKEYKDPIGPTLPESAKKKKEKREKSSHRSRRRSRSRSRRRRRSRSRDHHHRRRRRSRSARSKSSGRSSLNSREGSPAQDAKEPEPEKETMAAEEVEEEEPPTEVAPPIPRYAPASNHHPSMLAYPPPPKPDYMTPLDMMEKEAPTQIIKPQPITPGFVPPLPKLPHPDDLMKLKKEKEEKKDTSDSSDAEDNKNGYRSKYRNKAASSDEDTKPAPAESLYQSSISSFFTGVSKNVATLDGAGNGGPQLEPPPIKRYYGRRRENDSDSELSGLDSDSESKKRISHKIKQRVEKKTKEKIASKETLAEREKIRKKMQSQLKKTFKEDKKAEQERLKKLEEEQFYREEEMREISAKIKEKERERRRLERSRSRSRSRDRRRSRSRNRRRSRSQERRRSNERKDGRRRSRSRNDYRRHEGGGLVDY